MQITSLYPVITTDRVAESRAFYLSNFPFETTFDSAWYVSFRSRGGRCEAKISGNVTSSPRTPTGYSSTSLR